MNFAGFDIGVVSRSLAPTDTADLIRMMRQLNLSHLHLAIPPLMAMDEAAREAHVRPIIDAGIIITAGMNWFTGEDYSTIMRIRQTGGFVPDDLWVERREMTAMAASICKKMGVKLLSTHAGFIPISSGEMYKTTVDRVTEVAAAVEKEGVTLLLETGQEHASELLQFLNDVRSRSIAVSFDPANMLLYGAGDPVEAIDILGRHIRHVHVKDAKESEHPGVDWGTEVPFGTGDVNVPEFVEALRRVGYRGPLIVERESGTARQRDIQSAIMTLRTALV